MANTIRILHVDDEPDFVDLCAQYLEQEDDRFDVITETSPRAALEWLSEESVDCVVSDYEMSDLDGLAFLAEVREDHPDLPFLLFTGKGSEEIASEAISAGVTDYLQKGRGTSQYEVLANRIANAVEKHQAELSLRRREERLEALLKYSSDVVTTVDEDGEITYCSPSVERHFGYEHGQLADGDFSMFIHPEHRDRLDETVRTVKSGAESMRTIEFRFRHEDGSWRWVEAVVNDQSADPLIEGIVLNWRDITEQKAYERELEETNELLEAVIDASPAAILSYDRDGIVQLWNPAAEEIYGWSAEEVLGESLPMIPEGKEDEERAIYERVFGGEAITDLELRRETKSGQPIDISLSTAPVRDREGEVIGNVSVAQDITELKEREQELEAIRQRMELALAGTDSVIWERDLAADSFTRHGPVERVYGETDTGVGETMDDFYRMIYPDDRSAVREAMETAVETGGEYDAEYRVKADGEIRWFRTQASVGTNEAGQPTHVVGLATDITELKRRERELQRYETVIEALGDPVYALDAEGHYTFVNDAYVEETGYDRDELIGTHVSAVVPEADWSRGQDYVRQLLKDPERRSITWEAERVTAGGDPTPCEHHMALLPSDEDGTFQGTAGVIRDISDRREQQERLEEMTDRMQLALEGANSWIWDWNIETDMTTQTAVSGILGVEEETITRPIEDFIDQLHPEDQEVFVAAKEAAVRGDRAYHAEYRLTGGDEVRWIEARGQVYQDDSGAPARMIGIATDVTEQKERERVLERYRHLVNAIDDPVAIYDEAGRYDLVNERLAERFDTTPNELQGQQSELVEAIRDKAEGDPYRELLDGEREDITMEFQSPTLGPDVIMEYRLTRLVIDGTCEGAVAVSRNITEHKERERRIRALHESTQRLLAAETKEEVAELIAEAVKETLGYPCNVVRLVLDDQQLVPVAITDEMQGWLGGDRPAYEIGEGTAGYAFDQRETIVYEDVQDLDDDIDRGSIRGAMYLPIGDYGVVSIADREPAPFDASDINLAEILMANTEGVLERIERERELREQKERVEAVGRKYELVAEASTDAFWDWDPVTDEITRSEGYLSQFGYDESNIVAETDWWRDNIHPDDRERVLSGLQEAVEHPDVKYDETYRFMRKDGTYGFLRSRGHVVYDEDGEPTRMVGAHIDLSEREERERSITELHSATRTMLKTETKEEVAEHAVETARDVVGLPLTSIQLHDEDANLLRPVAYTDEVVELFGSVPAIEPGDGLIWRAFSTGEIEVHDDVREDPAVMNPGTEVRSQVILPLGNHGVLICNSTKVGDFGQIDVMLARLLAENTMAAMNRIDQEQTLRKRTRQLERTNERLEAFASVVSHDLRNPLNVAYGRLEMARMESDSEYLDDVKGALDRMDALINDLLSLAMNGRTPEDVELVDLASLSRRCWQNVETADAVLETESNLSIRAEPTRLQQLLENLFRNAVEHGGDDVTVTLGHREKGFFIEDDGPGIPAAEKEHVFESGYSTNDDGTGLGLAIVKEIVEAHGWEITVRDGDTGGTRFEITGVETE